MDRVRNDDVVGTTHSQYWQDRIVRLFVTLAPLWPQLARPMSKTSQIVFAAINTSMCGDPNIYNISEFIFVILNTIMNNRLN